jgi:hypothetical protein
VSSAIPPGEVLLITGVCEDVDFSVTGTLVASISGELRFVQQDQLKKIFRNKTMVEVFATYETFRLKLKFLFSLARRLWYGFRGLVFGIWQPSHRLPSLVSVYSVGDGEANVSTVLR